MKKCLPDGVVRLHVPGSLQNRKDRVMKMKQKTAVCLLSGLLAVSLAGCSGLGGSSVTTATATPTPAAPTVTPTPTLAPTSTPVPTPTAAPKIIGKKTSGAKSVYISNNTDKRFRKVYVRQSGYEDWGNNLIPSESSIRASEKIQMYYTPGEGDSVTYDMKWTDSTGNSYEMYSVQLSDMESASLRLDTEQGIIYLTYMSLSKKSEANTKDNSYSSGSWESTTEATSWYVYEPTTQSTTQTYTEPTTQAPVTEPATAATSDIYYYEDGNGNSGGGDAVVWDENGNWG